MLYLAGILPHLLSVWSFLKTLAPHEPRGFPLRRLATMARRDAPPGIGTHEPGPWAGRPVMFPTDDIPDLLTPRGQRAPILTPGEPSCGNH